MPRPHIAVIDASHGEAHVQRNFKRELATTITVFRASEGEIPQPLTSEENGKPAEASVVPPYDAVIISGSQSSVYHDEPWIAELTTWVRGAIDAELPILGIGWGHQLLAQILGGTVEDRGRYELGYVEVEQVGRDPFFEGVPNPFVVFAIHADEVTALPEEATLLAQNGAGIQAFRHGRLYGVQFHPEYNMRTAEDMIQRRDVSMHQMQTALESVTPEHVKAAQKTKQLLANFLALVQEKKEEEQDET